MIITKSNKNWHQEYVKSKEKILRQVKDNKSIVLHIQNGRAVMAGMGRKPLPLSTVILFFKLNNMELKIGVDKEKGFCFKDGQECEFVDVLISIKLISQSECKIICLSNFWRIQLSDSSMLSEDDIFSLLWQNDKSTQIVLAEYFESNFDFPNLSHIISSTHGFGGLLYKLFMRSISSGYEFSIDKNISKKPKNSLKNLLTHSDIEDIDLIDVTFGEQEDEEDENVDEQDDESEDYDNNYSTNMFS